MICTQIRVESISDWMRGRLEITQGESGEMGSIFAVLLVQNVVWNADDGHAALWIEYLLHCINTNNYNRPKGKVTRLAAATGMILCRLHPRLGSPPFHYLRKQTKAKQQSLHQFHILYSTVPSNNVQHYVHAKYSNRYVSLSTARVYTVYKIAVYYSSLRY